MRVAVLGFVVGVLALQQMPTLPDAWVVEFLPLMLLYAAVDSRARAPACTGVGFLWALFYAHAMLLNPLPVALEGHDVVVEGVVRGLPARDSRRTRFQFRVDRLSAAKRGGEENPGSGAAPTALRFNGLARLNWYGRRPSIRPGERWRLTVRLRRPHGQVNPGGFDYERYLYERGIRATGYVRQRPPARRLEGAPWWSLDHVRYALAERLTRVASRRPAIAIVKAITVGDRSAIDAAQWRVLRDTGTAHLMAISGLHIGLVALLMYTLVRRLWPWLGTFGRQLAAPRAALAAAFVAAFAYAALAGFSVPTQRALLMLGAVTVALLWRRRLPAGIVLAWAALVVLIADPNAVLTAGFWLSFAAVALLLFGRAGRQTPGGGFARWWWQWGHAQWLITLGTLPLLLLIFGRAPLLSPVANFIAVPWMGFLVVPSALAGTLLMTISPGLGAPLVMLAAHGIEWLWPVLEWLAQLGFIVTPRAAPPLWTVLAAVAGACLLLMPKRFPARAVGVLWMLPALLTPPTRPAEGAFSLTLLDVGQGLATVIETHRHVLVFDTGPRYGPGRDAGESVLLPYLRHQGVATVDRLVLSHRHADHIGGAVSLRAGMRVEKQIIGGARRGATACVAGHGWRWDGVDFRFLHPPRGGAWNENDASCVLRVEGPGGSAMVAGDIERNAEQALVEKLGKRLKTDVLVIPHHGSLTSSNVDFVRAVQPRYALISVGRLNRFRFPQPEVVARYREIGTTILTTADGGALRVTFAAGGGAVQARGYRETEPRYWRR